MIKLENKFDIINNFSSKNTLFIFKSIIEGLAPCEVFVNDKLNPNVIVIFEGKCCYISGEPFNDDEYRDVMSFIKSYILKSKSVNRPIYKFYYNSEIWKKLLLEALVDFNPAVYSRTFLSH